jgi:hypothetical protein
MTWRLTIAAALLATFSVAAPDASAQVDPKREKCLDEAVGKGLLTRTRTRGNQASNEALKEQRQAFMKECMRRK